MLEALLLDVQSRSIQDETFRLWYAELRGACYDIQDLLDPYLLLYRQQHTQTGKPLKVWFHKLLSRFALPRRLKSMSKKLNHIAERRNKFNLKEDVVLDWQKINKDRETFSEPEHVLLGRDEDVSEIVNLILQHQNDDQLFVIPIVGMGGLGKTTLAKLVFNDKRLRDSNHFELWAWAYVSIEFDLLNIGKRLVESLKFSDCNLGSLQMVSQELKNEASGKRFLIVLDDVWNLDMNDEWEKLKTLLKGGSNGSTVVVTTRIGRTAQNIATDVPYSLKTLSEETCMQLFQNRAFKSTEEMNNHPNLVEIGKEIVKKCGGVPLTANALGSMLCSQDDENLWLYVKDSEMRELHDENNLKLSSSENRILSSLKLSYNLMPPHLKLCFAYCSIFPKGHIIVVDKLVRHWISLSFIRSSHNTTLTTEAIAKVYLDNLVSLSFLQKCDLHHIKKLRDRVVMHDLMHDLARLVANDHDIKVVTDKENTSSATTTEYRYVSFHGSALPYWIVGGKVRALYLNNIHGDISYKAFSQLTSLRLLEIAACFISLPMSIQKLKHLQYFSVICYRVEYIPELLRNSTGLKHLLITQYPSSLSSSSIRLCSNLDTLYLNLEFTVQEEKAKVVGVEGVQQCCNIIVLHNLHNLNGGLTLRNLERVRNPKDAEKANLKEIHKLYLLDLNWDENELADKDVAAAVFQSLQPSSSYLRDLTVRGYGGNQWPLWMMDNNYKLEYLRLTSIENIAPLLEPIGQLQHLRELRLINMTNLRKIDTELFGGNEVALFPSLITFHLADMENLQEVWMSIFPFLKFFIVYKCPCLHSIRAEQPRSVSNILTINKCGSLAIGMLQHLRELGLRNMTNLRKIDAELFGGNQVALFPSLNKLCVTDMENLEEVWTNIFPCLNYFMVSYCPCLHSIKTEQPSFSLKILEFDCCEMIESLVNNLKQYPQLRSLKIFPCSNALKENLVSIFQSASVVTFDHKASVLEVHIGSTPEPSKMIQVYSGSVF